jgi:hypothetical protein
MTLESLHRGHLQCPNPAARLNRRGMHTLTVDWRGERGTRAERWVLRGLGGVGVVDLWIGRPWEGGRRWGLYAAATGGGARVTMPFTPSTISNGL